ncbi:MAG TPA: peptidoglycan-binding domain-containing protein [Thermomonas sp.]|nr:peptidoglycan-binding domain-containing protein [Thermomonas sp.]
MAKSIMGSVGRGGRNSPAVDVMTVQYLLNCVTAVQGGPSPELVVDGAAGPKTIAAIEKFQRSLGAFCDGRVDPGGATLRALQGRDPYPHQQIAAGGAKGGQGGGPPVGKGDPFGKSGWNNQAGYPPGKGGDPFAKGGGGSQGGFPPGKTGGGSQGGYPPGKGGDPFAKGGGGSQGGYPPGKGGGNLGGYPPVKGGGTFPGGKGGGGKGF